MSLRLSKKHGVNPSVLKCIFCGDDYGVALCGAIKGDAEAPRQMHHGFCEKCEEALFKNDGVGIIEVMDNDHEYRTGNIWAIKREVILKIYPQHKEEDKIIKMDATSCVKLGFHEFLPKEKECQS